MSELTKQGSNHVNGANNTYRALNSLGGLTTTFKNRFKQGIVKQLPPGFLYNTITKRFYSDTAKVRERFSYLKISMGYYNQQVSLITI